MYYIVCLASKIDYILDSIDTGEKHPRYVSVLKGVPLFKDNLVAVGGRD